MRPQDTQSLLEYVPSNIPDAVLYLSLLKRKHARISDMRGKMRKNRKAHKKSAYQALGKARGELYSRIQALKAAIEEASPKAPVVHNHNTTIHRASANRASNTSGFGAGLAGGAIGLALGLSLGGE